MTMPHFLQTTAWETFQNDMGRQTFRASGDGWQWMAILERGHLGSRLYCPYGPTVQHKAALHMALNELRKKAHETKVDFIRVEPQGGVTVEDMRTLDAVPAAYEMQPAHTWQVDLTQSEDDLLAAITSGNRRNFKNAAQHGLTFQKSYDPRAIELFLDCIHEVSARTGMQPHSDNYFHTQAATLLPLQVAAILTAYVHGQPGATMIAYDTDSTRYYAHAGAHYQLRKAQPSSALVCFAMLDAKAQGQTQFDFYGIAPPNQPNHPWAGLTKFKQSFGGYAVDYIGTWDIPLHQSRYRLSRMAQKAVRAKRYVQQRAKKH